MGYEIEFEDTFEGDELDLTRWVPYYLPHWSSRERTAARYDVGGGRLRLRIDPDQEPWCPELDGDIRVSSLQTGVFAGPVGSGVGPDGARVGMGLHPFGDPRITDEFAAEPLPIDAREFHVYAAEWTPDAVAFHVDGEHVKTVRQSPDYPMQLMLSLYDFPGGGPPDAHAKEFVVDYVRGYRRRG